MYHIFTHSSVDKPLGCFHVLANVNNAAMHIGVPASFQIIFFSEYMLRSGASGSYGSSVCSFLKHFYTVLNSD